MDGSLPATAHKGLELYCSNRVPGSFHGDRIILNRSGSGRISCWIFCADRRDKRAGILRFGGLVLCLFAATAAFAGLVSIAGKGSGECRGIRFFGQGLFRRYGGFSGTGLRWGGAICFRRCFSIRRLGVFAAHKALKCGRCLRMVFLRGFLPGGHAAAAAAPVAGGHGYGGCLFPAGRLHLRDDLLIGGGFIRPGGGRHGGICTGFHREKLLRNRLRRYRLLKAGCGIGGRRQDHGTGIVSRYAGIGIFSGENTGGITRSGKIGFIRNGVIGSIGSGRINAIADGFFIAGGTRSIGSGFIIRFTGNRRHASGTHVDRVGKPAVFFIGGGFAAVIVRRFLAPHGQYRRLCIFGRSLLLGFGRGAGLALGQGLHPQIGGNVQLVHGRFFGLHGRGFDVLFLEEIRRLRHAILRRLPVGVGLRIGWQGPVQLLLLDRRHRRRRLRLHWRLPDGGLALGQRRETGVGG